MDVRRAMWGPSALAPSAPMRILLRSSFWMQESLANWEPSDDADFVDIAFKPVMRKEVTCKSAGHSASASGEEVQVRCADAY